MNRNTDTIKAGDPQAYQLPDGTSFIYTAPPISTMNLPPFLHFLVGFDALHFAIAEIAKVKGDDNLSPAGRSRKIDPIINQTWSAFVTAHGEIDEYEAATDNEEAELLALPKLDASNTTTAIEDREARDWWRSQPPEVRAKLLQQFETDETVAERYKRLQLAMLRSPVPLPDLEHAAIRGLWERGRRLDDPAKALAIGQARDAVAWSRGALAHVQGVASRVTGWKIDDLANFLASSERGTKVARRFGFTPHGIEVARARIGHKAAA